MCRVTLSTLLSDGVVRVRNRMGELEDHSHIRVVIFVKKENRKRNPGA